MSYPDEMADIVADFLAEATESLDSLDQKFIELEKSPDDTGLLNDIFRSVHTIKGAAGFLGFEQMVEVTHITEDVLNKLRKGEMHVTSLIMDAILQSIDLIKVLLKNIKERNDRKEDCSVVIGALQAILSVGAGAKKDAPAPLNENITAPEPPVVLGVSPEAKAPEAVMPDANAEDKKAAVPAEQEKNAPQDASKARPKAEDAEKAREKDKEQSIRVDIDRLDSVLNLAGELVLSRNRLQRLGLKLSELDIQTELASHFNEAISQLDLVTSDLQLAVMKMRMQPVAKVFNKFPRLVRDLSRQTGKEIELKIRGEETELDKTVIEELGDPLVHLIRNSIDHGLESPEERALKGKPRCGTISLTAYQEGRHIMVSVEDDGKGIDPAVIKRSAVEKGLIAMEDAERLSHSDILNFIFVPGFSTAKQISNISGRGVGMDVVKTNIMRINGTISTDSEVGKGTKITFRLPLTLAIIQALTVAAGSEVYGIPLSTVIENIRLRDSDIKTVEGREVIHMRNTVYPILRLAGLIKGEFSATNTEWKYVVIIGIGEKRIGLLVDKLHGQEEIVMKSMGEYLKGTDGIAGACITGDGNVILILDVAGLVNTSERLYLRQ
ncbi:MAG: chemotaxis protein CheA [Deltaproteobacteria bacterium]